MPYTHLAWDLNVIYDVFHQIHIKIPRTKTTRTYCGKRVPSYLALGDNADCPRCNEMRQTELAEYRKLAALLFIEDGRE
jgi:hypothetical protein